MNTTNSRIIYLWQQFSAKKCTRAELAELLELLSSTGNEEESLRFLQDCMENEEEQAPDPEQWAPVLQNILYPVRPLAQPVRQPSKVRQILRLVVGAAAVVLLSLGIYTLWQDSDRHNKPVATTGPEIRPGGNKAILSLNNGQKIILDSVTIGDFAEQGYTRVQKVADGQLAYKTVTGTNNSPLTPSFNTLTTPRGGQYQLRLPDGTGVWLNAASSITFPTSFAGNKRQVTISGEVYFEVAADAGKPFLVSTGDRHMEVEVLGTSFNINAYPDNDAIRTTLLEGAIKVKTPETARVIRPGQQTVVGDEKKITLAPDIDPEEVLAWKNGLFQFNDADIRSVMRQLARWYDIEVRYEGPPTTARFQGKIPRNANASQVLRILQKNTVHFRIEGTTIVVLP